MESGSLKTRSQAAKEADVENHEWAELGKQGCNIIPVLYQLKKNISYEKCKVLVGLEAGRFSNQPLDFLLELFEMQDFASVVHISNKQVGHCEHRKKYAHAKQGVKHDCGNPLVEFNVHRLHIQVVVGKYILRVNYFALCLQQSLQVKLRLVVLTRLTL